MVLRLGFVCLLAGCAVPAVAPLDAVHPASPQAAEASAPVELTALAPEPPAPAPQPTDAPDLLPVVGATPAPEAAHAGHRHDR